MSSTFRGRAVAIPLCTVVVLLLAACAAQGPPAAPPAGGGPPAGAAVAPQPAVSLTAPPWILALYQERQGTIALRWNGVPDAAVYKVFRSQTSGRDYREIAIVPTQTQYEDTAVSPQTTYYYVLQAVAPGRVSPLSPETSVNVPAPPAPITAAPGGERREEGAVFEDRMALEEILAASGLSIDQFTGHPFSGRKQYLHLDFGREERSYVIDRGRIIALKIARTSVQALRGLRRLQGLEVLHLYDNGALTTVAGEDLPASLTTLHIWNSPKVTDVDLTAATGLETLSLNKCGVESFSRVVLPPGITSAFVQAHTVDTSPPPHLSRLRQLTIDAAEVRAADFTGCQQLEQFGLRASNLEDFSPVKLPPGLLRLELVRNPRLARLDLSGLPALKRLDLTGSTGLREVQAGGLRSLTELVLDECSRVIFSATSFPPAIRKIDLHRSDITLGDLARFPNLAELSINGGKSVDLAHLAELPVLETLTIEFGKLAGNLELRGHPGLRRLSLKAVDAPSLEVSSLPSLELLDIAFMKSLRTLRTREVPQLKRIAITQSGPLEKVTLPRQLEGRVNLSLQATTVAQTEYAEE